MNLEEGTDRTIGGGGTVNWRGTTIRNAADLTVEGEMVIHGFARLRDSATLTMAGGGRWLAGEFELRDGAVLINPAGETFDIQSDGDMTSGFGSAATLRNDGTLVKSGGEGTTDFAETRIRNHGTIEVQEGTLLAEDLTEHTGSLVVADDATLRLAHALTQSQGEVVLRGGTLDLDDTLTLAASGHLRGWGALDASLVNEASVTVGDEQTRGILTVTGDYQQHETGLLTVTLAGPAAGDQYDRLAVQGHAELAGTLAIEVDGAFVPPEGATFGVVQYGSREDGFTTVTGKQIDEVRELSLTYGTDALSLMTELDAEASVQWTGAASDRWDDPTNWSDGVLPGPGDHVLIDSGEDTVRLEEQDVQIAGLISQNPVRVEGGSLEVTEHAHMYGGMEVAGGTVSGGPWWVHENSIDLAGGTLTDAIVQGSGQAGVITSGDSRLEDVTLSQTELAIGNGVELDVTGDLTLDEATVRLERTSSLDRTRLRFDDGSEQKLTGSGEVLLDGQQSSRSHRLYLEARSGSHLIIDDGITVRQSGEGATIGDGSNAITNHGTIVQEGAGTTIEIEASPFVNEGTLRVLDGAALHVEQPFDQQADGRIELDGGVFEPNSTLALDAGVLAGWGTVAGHLHNAATVELAAGQGKGPLNVTGDYTQGSDALLGVPILDHEPGEGHGQLVVEGAANLDGELAIDADEMFVPVDGDTLSALEADQITGTFATVSGRELAFERSLSPSYGLDAFTLVAEVDDDTHPVVTDFEPEGLLNEPVTSLQVRFDKPINATTFTGNDVVIDGPDGPVDPASISVTAVDALTFDIALPEQAADGSYNVTIGPSIEDIDGREMEDPFSSAFELNLTPPQVSSIEPTGELDPPLASFEVVFDEPIDADTFTTDQAVLARPEGQDEISATSLAPVAGSEQAFTVTFDEQHVPGDYVLRIGPEVRDVAGNAMGEIHEAEVSVRPVDLVVQDLSVSASPALESGAAVTVSWSNANVGQGTTSGDWHDRVEVVNTTTGQTLVDTTTRYRSDELGDIEGGGVTPRSFTFDLPDGAAGAGNLDIQVTVDAHGVVPQWNEQGDADENTSASTAVTAEVGSYADLVLTDLDTSPGDLQSGDQVTVSWTTRNDGDAPADRSFHDRVIVRNLDTGELLHTRDLYYNVSSRGQIAPGASVNREESFTLPDGSAGVGEIEIEVIADVHDRVFEHNDQGTQRENNRDTITRTAELAPYPDLHVEAVTGPDQALPGETVQVAWEVHNAGDGEAAGTWDEAILLSSDGQIEGAQRLRAIGVSETIEPGGTVVRRAEVELPTFISGDHWLVVRADPGNALQEHDTANNAAVAQAPTHIPHSLSLSTNRTAIAEDAGEQAARLTIARNGPTDEALEVSLAADTGDVTLPESVTIEAGRSTARVDIGAVDNELVVGDRAVRIEVSADQMVSDELELTVSETREPRLRLEIDAEQIDEGDGAGAATGTLRHNIVSEDPIELSLRVTDASKLSVPATVTVPGGEREVSFDVDAVDNDVVDGTRSVRILASGGVFPSVSGSLEVTDNDVPQLELALSSDEITEGAPSPAAVGTIRIQQPLDHDLAVRVTSEDSSAVEVERTVVIAEGEVEASFLIDAPDTDTVYGERDVQITARPISVHDELLEEGSAARTVTVLDNDSPSLSLSLDRSSIAEDGQTTVTVERNTPADDELVVSLESLHPDRLSVPDTVTLAAGQSSATFVAEGVVGGVEEGVRSASIRAQAEAHNPGIAPVHITTINLPDLAVTDLQFPGQARTGELINVSWTVENQGLSEAFGVWQDRLFLIDENGNEFELISLNHGTTLNVDESYTRTRQVELPELEGSYRLRAITDYERVIHEGSQGNNRKTSTDSVEVLPAYTASVEAHADNVPTGTPIPLSGQALDSDSGEPVADRTVAVHVLRNGTSRTLEATTDANGQFETTFQPLPLEAGMYEVAASHPGAADPQPDDTFTILGMRFSERSASHRLLAGEQLEHQLTLENLADVPVSDIDLELVGVPEELGVNVELPEELGPEGEGAVSYTIDAGDLHDVGIQGQFLLRATSAAGAVAELPVSVRVDALEPNLEFEPGRIERGMLLGERTRIDVTVRNTGGAETGELDVDLPDVDWMELANGGRIASLAPGEAATLRLSLTPSDTMPPQEIHSGRIALNSAAVSETIRYELRAISEARGDARVTVTDDFTYHAEGAPRVENAQVQFRDPFTHEVVAEGVTEPDGSVLIENLPEGRYTIEIRGDNHNTYRQTHEIVPGIVNDFELFLKRQIVQHRWNVEHVEVEDRYRVTIESEFEANVPVPVVTMHMPDRLPPLAVGESTQIDVTLVNDGLVAAEQVELLLPENDNFEFEALVTELGDLDAKSAVMVPVKVTRTGDGIAQGGAQDAQVAGTSLQEAVMAAGGGDNCHEVFASIYSYECVETEWERSEQVLDLGTECGATGTRDGAQESGSNARSRSIGQWTGTGEWTRQTGGRPGGDGGSSNRSSGQPAIGDHSDCDECRNELLDVTKDCVERMIPFPDWYSCGSGIHSIVSSGSIDPLASLGSDPDEDEDEGDLHASFTSNTAYNAGKTALACLRAAGRSVPGPPKWLKFVECSYDFVTACNGIGGGPSPFGDISLLQQQNEGPVPGLPEMPELNTNAFDDPELQARLEEVQRHSQGVHNALAAFGHIFGHADWLDFDDPALFADWVEQFEQSVEPDSEGGETITDQQRDHLLSIPAPDSVSAQQVEDFIDRWNRSIEYWDQDILTADDLPEGWNDDFIAVDVMHDRFLELERSMEEAQAAGYASPDEAMRGATVELRNALEDGEGLCAEVRLQLEQEVVMTRDAFRGTLEIQNGHATGDIEQLAVDLEIRDMQGNDATNRFGIHPPDLSGIDAVDGTGSLGAGEAGSASWLLIPSQDAAPDEPTQYRIGGTFSYIDPDSGDEIVTPLLPDIVTVEPDPNLELRYFHQRDVIGNDPFTEEIEPSEPFYLGLLVTNNGEGTARDFSITSAQPEIIDNERGLLIDFEILGTSVDGQGVEPTLTATLGDIEPGQTTAASWQMISSLQGRFVDYDAEFEHLDGMGDPSLSLIDSVDIHEMIRPVQVGETGPDFLVNDDRDAEATPDTLYTSEGEVYDVEHVLGGQFSNDIDPANMTTTLTAPVATSGFHYQRLADPSGGTLELDRIVREDGTELEPDNAWTTDRTFTPSGVRDEQLLHIFDEGGSGQYTIHYTHPEDYEFAVNALEIPGQDDLLVDTPPSAIEAAFTGPVDTETLLDGLGLVHNGQHVDLDAFSLGIDAIEPHAGEGGRYQITGLEQVMVSPGYYQFTLQGVEVNDVAGNTGGGSATHELVVESAPPFITEIDGPADDQPRNEPVSAVDIVFSETIDATDFDHNYITLTRDGGVDLADSSVSVIQIDNDRLRISGLSSLTHEQGEYELTIDATGVTDNDGLVGIGERSLAWTMDTFAPAIEQLEQVTRDVRATPVSSLRVELSEPIVSDSFDIDAVTLTRNGGQNLIDDRLEIERESETTYVLRGLSTFADQEGIYELTVDAAMLEDAAGNSGQGAASTSWQLLTTPPQAPTDLALSPAVLTATDQLHTGQQNLTLTGNLDEPGLEVHVFNETVRRDLGTAHVEDQAFTHDIELAANTTQTLRIQAVDQAGNRTDAHLDVHLDRIPPQLEHFSAISPDPRIQPLDSVDLHFSESLADDAVTLSDLALTRDGNAVALDDRIEILAVSDDLYRVEGLEVFTAEPGTYELTLDQAGVFDLVGNMGSGLASTGWETVPEDAIPLPELDELEMEGGEPQRSTLRELELAFSEPVTLASDALDLVHDSGQSVELSITDVTGDAQQYELHFSGDLVEYGSLVDGYYELHIDASLVQDEHGRTMGDETAVYSFHRLYGDATGNAAVGFADLLAFREAYNSTEADPEYDPALDLTGNGSVGFPELARFRDNYQTTLDIPDQEGVDPIEAFTRWAPAPAHDLLLTQATGHDCGCTESNVTASAGFEASPGDESIDLLTVPVEKSDVTNAPTEAPPNDQPLQQSALDEQRLAMIWQLYQPEAAGWSHGDDLSQEEDEQVDVLAAIETRGILGGSTPPFRTGG